MKSLGCLVYQLSGENQWVNVTSCHEKFRLFGLSCQPLFNDVWNITSLIERMTCVLSFESSFVISALGQSLLSCVFRRDPQGHSKCSYVQWYCKWACFHHSVFITVPEEQQRCTATSVLLLLAASSFFVSVTPL